TLFYPGKSPGEKYCRAANARNGSGCGAVGRTTVRRGSIRARAGSWREDAERVAIAPPDGFPDDSILRDHIAATEPRHQSRGWAASTAGSLPMKKLIPLLAAATLAGSMTLAFAQGGMGGGGGGGAGGAGGEPPRASDARPPAAAKKAMPTHSAEV